MRSEQELMNSWISLLVVAAPPEALSPCKIDYIENRRALRLPTEPGPDVDVSPSAGEIFAGRCSIGCSSLLIGAVTPTADVPGSCRLNVFWAQKQIQKLLTMFASDIATSSSTDDVVEGWR